MGAGSNVYLHLYQSRFLLLHNGSQCIIHEFGKDIVYELYKDVGEKEKNLSNNQPKNDEISNI